MSVLLEHRGPWILIAHRLRFTKDSPPRHDKVVERPRSGRKGNWTHFLDDPDANHGDEPGPTLVTFDLHDAVDVPQLLKQGALREPSAAQLPPKESKGKPSGPTGTTGATGPTGITGATGGDSGPTGK